MHVVIDGIEYVPVTDIPLRPPSGKHPSDICRKCGEESFSTKDSRNKDGYRYRRKVCLNCGYMWNTIEYMYLPKGRPPSLDDYDNYDDIDEE